MNIDWEEIIFKAALSFLGVGIICLLVLIPFMVVCSNKAEESFMAECLADNRKQYECTAMWRAGKDNTAVMPMPLIIR